jgi:hypothetical protein
MKNMKRIGLIFSIAVLLVGTTCGTGLSETQLKEEQKSHVSISGPHAYLTTPDWVSEKPHYSTGAALADFNRDGWLDLVVADGNDMKPGRLNLYYNQGDGTFPRVASWQSRDIGYNGHLDVADVNGDGWPDVAVAYLGEFTTVGPIARVYLNNQGVLSSLPDWTSDVKGNAFAVDFGDMNNDGRPDLAVATGWCYDPQRFYHNYIYLNVDGTLESSASWQSDDVYHSMGVLWVDADDDGWLDVAFIGTDSETRIYRNHEGVIETTASWQTEDSHRQYGIMLTVGDVSTDGILDLFATDNIQLGGSGLFKQYNGLSEGFFETKFSWSYYEGYGSAVALADVNGDDKLDLATGAWWDYTRIFYNNGAGFDTKPSWSSEGTSVVEKIVFGDVGPSLHKERIFTERFSNKRSLFHLSRQPIQRIQSVKRDGVELKPSEYTYSREHSWITVNNAPAEWIEVTYVYSRSIDMVISNWDSHLGNFLYYNQLFNDDLECEGSLSWSDVKPGEVVEGSFTVKNIGVSMSELDWKVESYPEWGRWTFNPVNGEDLTPESGVVTVEVSVVAPEEKNEAFTGEIKIVNCGDSDDFGIIPVSLTTTKQSFTLLEKLSDRFQLLERICSLFGAMGFLDSMR